jgi:hypothetical protein
LLDAKSKILKFPNYGNVTEGHRLHYDAWNDISVKSVANQEAK